MDDMTIPYEELDPPIVGLVRTINEIPGIHTNSSCSGHEEDHGDPPDRWHVGFGLDTEGPDDPWPTPDAWLSLEWLVWFVNGNLRRGTGIEVTVNAPPPWLNEAGVSIYFMLEGARGERGMEPDEFAAELVRTWNKTPWASDEQEGPGLQEGVD